MDSETVLFVVVIFALLAVVLMLLFRQRAKFKVQGPAGMSIEAEGSNEPPSGPTNSPGVLVENARSHGGGLTAEDETGRGATVRGIEVQQDINVRSGSGPKADPPA